MEPIQMTVLKITCALWVMRAIVHHLITPSMNAAEAAAPARSAFLVNMLDALITFGIASVTATWVRG